MAYCLAQQETFLLELSSSLKKKKKTHKKGDE